MTADTELTFRVTVSDGQATASHDVVVTVRKVNRAPVANAGDAVSVKGKARSPSTAAPARTLMAPR